MNTEYAKYSNEKTFVAAVTSDFDRLFELYWRTLKEYLLKDKGIAGARTGSPKDIIKLAYQQRLINDEDFYLKILADRNDDSHHYNESAARSYASRVLRDYLPKIAISIKDLKDYIPEEDNILVNVPDDFIEACDLSGMFYDEFLEMVKKDNFCTSDLEVFQMWDRIKDKYLIGTI